MSCITNMAAGIIPDSRSMRKLHKRLPGFRRSSTVDEGDHFSNIAAVSYSGPGGIGLLFKNITVLRADGTMLEKMKCRR